MPGDAAPGRTLSIAARAPDGMERGLVLPRRHAERRVWIEEAETMAPPAGAAEDLVARGAPPSGQVAARVAMTRLARELGREYRIRHGVILTVDATGLDTIQRHLPLRLEQARASATEPAAFDAELIRHGAFLSELLARRLGAEWVELADSHPNDWTMQLPPGIRVWPVWRIHNFVRQPLDRGALVAFYEHLKAQQSAS